MGEIIKEQMAEAGITVNLVNTTNIVQDFFTDAKAPSALIPLRRAGLDKVTRNLSRAASATPAATTTRSSTPTSRS